MKNLARDYHNEKNNCIDLEAPVETQNMVNNKKQQHTFVKKQQRESQQLDPDKGYLSLYTNSEPLQKTFQCWNANSRAKRLCSLKKITLREKLLIKDTCNLKKKTNQYLDT